jgi:hypothetical protein
MTRFEDTIRRTEDIESSLAAEFARVAEEHEEEPGVAHLSSLFAEEAEKQANKLVALATRRGDTSDGLPPLLDDLTRLYLHVQEAWIYATIVRQGALAKRDEATLAVAESLLQQAARQAKWLTTRIKTTAPQALTVE